MNEFHEYFKMVNVNLIRCRSCLYEKIGLKISHLILNCINIHSRRAVNVCVIIRLIIVLYNP